MMCSLLQSQRRFSLSLLCVFVALLGWQAVHSAALLTDAQTVVQTQYGKVRGMLDAITFNEVTMFQGVPFGAPPTGPLRFRPPQPPQSWSGVRNTIKPIMCAQINLLDVSQVLGFEDCLYVDVYTPTKTLEAQLKEPNPKELRPVMVYIFGGAFTLGDKFEFGNYDGRFLAKKHNVVVVTINYRVGPLGFLALDELRREGGDLSGAGNQGLLDQRMALRWVQQNIANFGGNPNQVTIFGESAGGMSVCSHLVSEASAGLFHAAIMESGSCDSEFFFAKYEQARQWATQFSALVGCNFTDPAEVLECMLDVNVKKIFEGMGRAKELVNDPQPGITLPPLFPLAGFVPTIDGTAVGLAARPVELIAKGAVKVPVLLGTNADEGTIFGVLLKNVIPGHLHFPMTDDDVDRTLKHVFGSIDVPGYTTPSTPIGEVLKSIYRADASFDGKPRTIFANAIRDFFFACSARRTTRALLQSSSAVPAYQYFFSYRGHGVTTKPFGVHHMAEVPFVFDADMSPLLKMDSDDRRVSKLVGQYWTNFASFFDPNGAAGDTSLPAWKPLTQETPNVLEITLPAAMRDPSALYSHCDLMDRLHEKLLQ